MADIVVINNPERRRFEVEIDGVLAVLKYRQDSERITLIHTEVPEALSGRGIGGALAKAALEYARDHQLKVDPFCPFVQGYLRTHQQYQDLLERPLS